MNIPETGPRVSGANYVKHFLRSLSLRITGMTEVATAHHAG